MSLPSKFVQVPGAGQIHTFTLSGGNVDLTINPDNPGVVIGPATAFIVVSGSGRLTFLNSSTPPVKTTLGSPTALRSGSGAKGVEMASIVGAETDVTEITVGWGFDAFFPEPGWTGPGESGATIWFDTIQEAEDSEGPEFPFTLAWIVEVQAFYRFSAGSTATVDDWTVLSVTGGVAGRWLAITRQYTLKALGGGRDDWPRLIGCVNALAPLGGSVTMSAVGGNWQCLSVVELASQATLIGTASTVVTMNLTPGTGQTACAFYALRTNLGPNLTLAGNITSGAMSFTTTTSPTTAGCTIGGMVTIVDTNTVQSYVIQNIVGNVVTVERPILIPFRAATTIVFASTVPTNIHILGNGMTVNALSGDRVIELVGAWYSEIDSININSVTTGGHPGLNNFGGSLDTGGYRSRLSRVIVNGGGTVVMCLACESSEFCVVDQCQGYNTATNAVNAAFYAYSARNLEIRACVGRGKYGLLLDSQSGGYPSDQSKVIDSDFSDAGEIGVFCTDGAHGWTLQNVTAYRCGTFGCVINDSGGGAPSDLTFIGCRFNGAVGSNVDIQAGSDMIFVGCSTNDATVDGITIESGVLRVQISAHEANGCGRWGLNTASEALVSNFQSNGCGTGGSGGGIAVSGGAYFILDDFAITATFDGNAHLIEASGSTGVQASNGRLMGGGAGNKFAFLRNAGVATDTLSFLTLSATFGYYNNNTNSTLRAWGNDYSGSGAPFTAGAGTGGTDFGTVTLNGIVAVVVPYTAILATDHVVLTRKTAGGTPSALPPTYTITAGTGFSVVSATVGANDVYDYKIVRQ